MRRYFLWRKLATWLLLVSFVLPLARCDGRKEEPGVVPTSPTYLYGYKLAYGNVVAISEGAWHCIGSLAIVLGVFFVPLLALCFRNRWQPWMLICASFPSLYVLYQWMTDWGRVPQIGGILAMECWLFLLLLSVLQLRAGGQAR